MNEQKQNKRPGTVIVFSVLSLIGLVFQFILVYLAYQLRGMGAMFWNAPLWVADLILATTLISAIPFAIFLYLFFTLKKSCLNWLYVSFGINILYELVSMSFFSLIITVLFGWAIWDYVRNKKIDENPLFT